MDALQALICFVCLVTIVVIKLTILALEPSHLNVRKACFKLDIDCSRICVSGFAGEQQ